MKKPTNLGDCKDFSALLFDFQSELFNTDRCYAQDKCGECEICRAIVINLLTRQLKYFFSNYFGKGLSHILF